MRPAKKRGSNRAPRCTNVLRRGALAALFSILGISLTACGGGEGPVEPATQPQTQSRPNIVVILADDLGYSDIGAMGSEIKTPNIDSLAKEGRLLLDFNAAPACSPSRAMLMTGTDSHEAGLGVLNGTQIPEQMGQPGYEGYLNSRVVTVASLLKDAGYHTYMSGKWDLGGNPSLNLPNNKGFEQSFTFRGPAASHFSDRKGTFPGAFYDPIHYFENGQEVTALPADFFSSDFYAAKLISQIKGNLGDKKPFFGYLSFTAPHWPLQVPDSWRDRYRGRYDQGYEVLLSERLATMKRMGLISNSYVNPGQPKDSKAWTDLTPAQKEYEIRKMEIYAAMVENMDYNIGKLIQFLKDNNSYDNTIIVFASDNGAEGQDPVAWLPSYGPDDDPFNWYLKFNNSLDNIGRPNSFAAYGAGWATASVGPGRLKKSYTANGGIRVPAIVKWPGESKKGSIERSYMTLMDLTPTFLEVAGTKSPDTYEGVAVKKPRGESLVGYFNGSRANPHGPEYGVGVELFGNRGYRLGNWKIVATRGFLGTDQWELYDIAADPQETMNLAATNPAVVADLGGRFNRYASDVGLILAPVGSFDDWLYCPTCIDWLDAYNYPYPYVKYGQ